MSAIRIIYDLARSPAFNMAADLHLMGLAEKTGGIFVRFYQWDPPCITIGYMQDGPTMLDAAALGEKGIAWIRRPTGGRAVLHQDDITYSCIFSSGIVEMGKTVAQTYRIISACLLEGLKGAGIACFANDSFDQLRDAKREVKLPCFLSPGRDEIMVGGRKLIGSAQKRSEGAVLQHGSIPLTHAYRFLPDYLLISDEQRTRQKELLKRKSICLEEIDPRLGPGRLREALAKGFREGLPFEAEEIPWSKEEVDQIQVLARSERFRRKRLA